MNDGNEFSTEDLIKATSVGRPRVVIDVPGVPADVSPAEIMEAWKQAQQSAGRDPNAVFAKQFHANAADGKR